MNSAVRLNFNENFVKKVLVGPVNSAPDPLSWTQTQLKPSFSSIQTQSSSPIEFENLKP